MVIKIADNITSPLGLTTADNLRAVLQNQSALSLHHRWDMPEAFMASLFSEAQMPIRNYVVWACLSIREALTQCPQLDITSPRLALVMSSTKGNTTGSDTETFGASAQRIADDLGITSRPVTVSNACISGLAAQILAMRLIESGEYETVIVCGCDVQTKFIVSGFQSFKALSADPCRPFDEDRYGLNLGEAVATIIYTHKTEAETTCHDWVIKRGAIRNDAYHISGPSRTAEGCYRAIRTIAQDIDSQQIACINAHGTATLYNDDMESKAIERAGLSHLPVNGLKGYFGHTMGAAGVLETVVMMHAIDQGWIPGTRGYAACGTSCPLLVTSQHQPAHKTQFIKLMSGFGGCNAAALFTKGGSL